MPQASDEDRFPMLVEHNLDSLVLLQPDGRVSYVTPATRLLLGYTPDEFRELGIFQTTSSSDQGTADVEFTSPGNGSSNKRRFP